MKDSKLGLLFLSFPKLSEKSVKLGNKKKMSEEELDDILGSSLIYKTHWEVDL